MKSHHYGSVAVIAAAILWSLDGLLRRELFNLPPSVVVFWEHLLGILVLAPVIYYLRKHLRNYSREQWIAIIVVSFLSGALGTVMYTAALTRTQFAPFSVVVLLQQLQPIFAIATASVLLKEKISPRLIGLAAIAIGAAYFTAFPDLTVDFENDRDSVIAAMLAVGAAASWGSSTALSKFSLKGMNSLQVTATRFALVPFFAFGIAAVMGDAGQLGEITGEQWRYLVAITFSTGLVALGLYYFGLKRILASRSTLLELAWPASAVIIGYFFLDETFTATQWLGAGVLTGVITYIARTQIDEKVKDF